MKYKALTIHQPYASFIRDGVKLVENRDWFTYHRGPLLIHAGKKNPGISKASLSSYPLGAIIAIVDMYDCVHIDTINSNSEWSHIASHTHTHGPYCFLLRGVQAFSKPIECRGFQGLWNYEITPSEIDIATGSS